SIPSGIPCFFFSSSVKSLGYADGEKIPWHEMLAAVQRVAGAVRVPVTADIEGGFSSTTPDLIHRTEEVIQVGACGINIEDGLGHGASLRSVDDASERISAVRRTATKLGIHLVINARTDFYLNAGSNDPALFDQMLARCRAYVAAGADCVYPLGLVDLAQITKLVAALAHPVNIIGCRGTPGIPELQAAGVARVSTATTPALYVAGALSDSMTKLIQTGSFDHFTSSFDYARLQKLFASA
ncbi:MAG: isocitrate lyase/phosphoenolpyruvate mutase family protein, partial [Gammaproteobacteria bacterium]